MRGDYETNLKKAKEYCREAALHGYIPIAPHVYFTLFLNDENETERKLGMGYGWKLLRECNEVWVYGPDITEGMSKDIKIAKKLRKKIVYKNFVNSTYQLTKEGEKIAEELGLK